MRSDHDTRSSKEDRRINRLTLLVLLLLVFYAGLTLYSGTLLPLRLIKGTSMEPELRAGDIVLLKKIPFSNIKVGDVIAYTTPDAARTSPGTPSAILHRVIKSKPTPAGTILTTKGDNSDVDPWPVTSADFHGAQVMHIPYVAKPLVFLTSPRGILFLSIGTLITLLYFPAMMIFHMVVIKKPQTTTALAVTDSRAMGQNSTLPSATREILGEVERLKGEQEKVSGSLLQLSESISFYATNLQSHTEVVQNLASVTNLLKSTVQEHSPSGKRSALITVMIVDDQEPFRNRARDVVELEGEFRVVAEASDGSEAVELMEKVHPDVIVMDVQMPQMNGFEAARRINEQYPGITIAMVSMDGEQQYSDMAEEAGAKAFISKKDLSAKTLKQIIQPTDTGEG